MVLRTGRGALPLRFSTEPYPGRATKSFLLFIICRGIDLFPGGMPAWIHSNTFYVPGISGDSVFPSQDIICTYDCRDTDFVGKHLLFFGIAGAGGVL